jgi:hypothetical protein
MTKQLTFTKEPEGDELLITEVDDLCGKRSAPVTKTSDGRHSLLVGSIALVAVASSMVNVLLEDVELSPTLRRDTLYQMTYLACLVRLKGGNFHFPSIYSLSGASNKYFIENR